MKTANSMLPCVQMKRVCTIVLFFFFFVGVTRSNDTTAVKDKVVFYGGKDNSPFEFINEQGEPDGFHVDLLRELMLMLNQEYELHLKGWEESIGMLKKKQIDGMIGLIHSKERMEYVNFTIPTSYVYASVMHRKGGSYRGPVDAFGQEVLVMAGCKSEEYIRECAFPVSPIRVNSFEEGFKLLEDGKYDLMIGNEIINTYYLKHHKNSQLKATAFNIIEPLPYSIAINNENPELLYRLNNALHILKMSGRFDQLYNKWLREDGNNRYKEVFLILFVILFVVSILGVLFVFLMKKKVAHAVRQLAEEQKYTRVALDVGGLTAWEYDCVSHRIKILHGTSIGKETVGEMTLEFFLAILHPEDKGNVLEIIRKVEINDLEGSIIKFRVKIENVWRWFLTSYIAVKRNEKIVTLIGVRRDITWEVENEELMQEQIKEVEEHGKELLNILENIPTPISVKKISEGKYIYANKSALHLFGSSFEDRMPFKVLSSSLGSQAEKIKESGTYEATEVIELLDGKVLVTIVKSVVIDYNNEPHMLISRVDLTEINKAKSDSQLLSKFVPVLKGFTWQLDPITNALKIDHRMELEREINKMTQLNQFVELVHIDDQKPFFEYIQCLKQGDFEGGKAFQFRLDIEGKGVYEWWEVFASAEATNGSDEAQIYNQLSGISINIDERKKAELKLYHLHKQHELVLNNISSTLVHIDSNYEVIWSNSQNASDPSLAAAYKVGGKCYQLLGKDSPCENCAATRAMKSGTPHIVEFVLDADGEVYEAIASPLRGDSGMEGAVIRIDNVTERKKLISDLEAANQLMGILIDELPSIFFIKDVKNDFRYVFASSIFCDSVAKKPRSEVIGSTDYEIFQEETIADKFRKDDWNIVNQCKSGDVVLIGEERIGEVGKERIIDTKKLLLELPNQKKYLIGQSTDITELQRINRKLLDAKEQAEKADKLKSAFLANMSHEIRTPLNAIVGFSQLLSESNDVNERMEYSKIIETNNDLLLRLISDILDLSKLEAGSVELHFETFDFSRCMEETYATLAPRCQQVELRLYNPFSECVVTLDKNRCLQIVTNYLNNAVKFTKQGFIEIGYDYQENGLLLFVRDTGIGISEEKQNRLFHRFQKLDDFAQGTGLGLSICKAIAETMQGRVWAESKAGEGSTFFAWIPCEANLTPKEEDS
ncbi:MAG: ATP-binding protein [Phocaeicola sp.]